MRLYQEMRKNAVTSLEIQENKFLLSDTSGINDPIEIALKKI